MSTLLDVKMSKNAGGVVGQPGKIVLSGASGMLGTALLDRLRACGTPVLRLIRTEVRGAAKAEATPEEMLVWDPAAIPAIRNPAALEGCTAAVHLSGASVAGQRWTPAYKREIVASRVDSTRVLATMLANLKRPPKTLVVASAVGIYGDRGDQFLDESSAPGTGFLADVCQRWEEAAQPAERAGIRVVHARFGVVLGRGPGAVEKMLPVFRLGLGGKLGSGRQWMGWISVEDVVGAIQFALETEALAGAVNFVSPNPVTNAEFTRVLGQMLHRPAVLPVPAFALRLAFGEMADEALLASALVAPAKLIGAGFRFAHPRIEDALGAALEIPIFSGD
jgi:uncharacterized protein (TIGR01777 family)